MATRGGPEEEHLQRTPAGFARAEKEALARFRATHPARFSTQPLAGNEYGRPGKIGQEDWHVYTSIASGQKIMQQHLIVPVLTQPLAGPTPAIDGIRDTVPWRQEGREHVTNIERMEVLLTKHPLVGAVEKHKPYKADGPQILEANGSGRV